MSAICATLSLRRDHRTTAWASKGQLISHSVPETRRRWFSGRGKTARPKKPEFSSCFDLFMLCSSPFTSRASAAESEAGMETEAASEEAAADGVRQKGAKRADFRAVARGLGL